MKDEFIQQIKKNLENNGFPTKKVSFDIEKMYELADKKGLSFNSILDDLREMNIESEITVEKIIFSQKEKEQEGSINPDMMKEAQEMMNNMSEDEIENIKKMYENMSEEEKSKIMEQAKKMGMF